MIIVCCYIDLFGAIKGNMLPCMYGLKVELKLFIKAHRNQKFLFSFTPKGFELTIAYLVGIFEVFDDLNRLLQVKNTNCIGDYDAIHAFMANLSLWQLQVE